MNHITSAVFIGAAVPTAAGAAEPVTGSGAERGPRAETLQGHRERGRSRLELKGF